MKVILFEENRVAEVSDGHARNYLLPKKLAILATPQNLKRFEKIQVERSKEIAEQKVHAEELRNKLESKELVVKADAGEEGKLFGTITSKDVVSEVKNQFGIELEKKKVNLNEHIKTLGEFSASAKLHHEVTAHIKIRVEKK